MTKIELKEIRKALGLTQKAMGTLLGYNTNHIARLENDEKVQITARCEKAVRWLVQTRVSWRGKRWDIAKQEAILRDNNTCQACSTTAAAQGRNMDVHHRISYSTFATEDEANALPNLICLCRSCHRKVESGILPCPDETSNTPNQEPRP